MAVPTVYWNGEYRTKDEVAVSPDDRGFLLGDGVYEVVRTYDGRILALKEHLERLKRSVGEIEIEVDPTLFVALEAVCRELLERNALTKGEATVYLQITRGVAPRTHAFPSPTVQPTVYAAATPFTPHREAIERGASAVTAPDIRWLRCDVKSISLLPNVLANTAAKRAGAVETIMHREGVITEGSHTNVMAVIDDAVWTHPIGNRILSGITRQIVLEECRAAQIPVVEAPFSIDALSRASEAWVCGTTADVTPIIRIDGHPVGNGEVGPITSRVQELFAKRIAR